MKCKLCTRTRHGTQKRLGFWWLKYQICEICHNKIIGNNTLEKYKCAVTALARFRKWNNRKSWLMTGLMLEFAELINAIYQKKSDQEKGEEFADVMHFLLQLMAESTKIDLDKAMNDKIEKNKVTPKKTLVNNMIMLK